MITSLIILRVALPICRHVVEANDQGLYSHVNSQNSEHKVERCDGMGFVERNNVMCLCKNLLFQLY